MRLALLCSLVVPLAAQQSPRSAEPAASLRERARRIVLARDLQDELPNGSASDPLDFAPDIPISGPIAWLAQVVWLLAYAVLVGAAVLLVVWVAGIHRDPAKIFTGEDAAVGADGAGALVTSLEAADALAAAGRLAEAVHALLLLAIDALAARASLAVPPAITARELGEILELNEEGESAYARLVRATELVLFGGRPARPETYEGARDDYLRLVGEGP